MKPIWLWIGLLLSVGINLGVLATIGTNRLREPARWERGPRDHPPPVERVADRLGLEGEKREVFIQVQTDFFQGMRQSREDLDSLRQQLRGELMTASPDRAEVDRLVAEMGEAYVRLDRVFVDNVLRSREILDPEQEQQYLGFLERLREHGRPEHRRSEGFPQPPRERKP
jgi:hypothetical protein